jgi:putative heme-binding domain-containing protein
VKGDDGKDEGNRVTGAGAKALVFCTLPSAMPRTGKAPDSTPQGLDVALARLIGQVLRRSVEFHWCASPECSWHCLSEGRCDVVAGQPDRSGPARGVAWSVPYAGAQFGLVVPSRASGVHSLADLRGERLGIVAGTVAVSENDHAIARFRSREALLEGFQAAALQAAFLDGDFAAWYLHEHPGLLLRFLPEYVPREHWNMALALRSRDAGLLVEINRALAQLAEAGELQKVYAGAGVPYRAPFASEARQKPASGTWRRIQERGELTVSMDPANLPYSSARDGRPGIDVELARAVAQQLRVKLRIEWLDVQRETIVGALLQRQCDAVLGEAVAANAVADDEELAGKVIYSRPYYGTGYVLVQRKNGPHARSLRELKGARSQRLGTEAGSVADYHLRQRGYLRRLFRNQLATLKALSDGQIDHAYLWANVGWTLHASSDLNAELSPGYVPEDHWNIAIAMRAGDEDLKEHVDAAVGELIAQGTVAQILDRYHVPYFPPFAEPPAKSGMPAVGVPPARGYSSSSGPPEGGTPAQISTPAVGVSPSSGTRSSSGPPEGGIPAQGVRTAKRGPEPQMQKIQVSKRPYAGLARIRAAGELIVGLDQNNLPFSSAHPEPAGLDYEIAALLAGQLGVRLRVYWAYSGHDSYASKVAAKGLCDVILGVMSDSRFEHRVLFSQPYYCATYQWLTRAGAASPSENEPVAVEAGVAIRGLEGRAQHRYPSTEAILEAVARGQEQVGYVISARAHWLAQTRWPGKLAFLAPGKPADGFPIAAAVRKSEGELKLAIDQAWTDLDRSGRLAEVFGRWDVPYERSMRTEKQSGSGAGAPRTSAPPLASPPDVAEGQALFRGLCSGCHGGLGRGGKGPDLTDSRWIHGSTDEDITAVIRNGVPRTTMKKLGDALKPEQIRKVVAYIRSLARPSGESGWKPYVSGDPQAGRKLFFDPQSKVQCARCHSVGSEGGRVGPALDRIANRRAPEYIMESILQPSSDIAPEYEAAAVLTKEGRLITGVRINETNFSIQLHEENGSFHSFLKRDLDAVKVMKQSLMPDNVGELLTVKELHDLFAYLMTLE